MRVLGDSVAAAVWMQVGLRCVCVCAVSERLRGVDYMGWQVAVLDVSFRHIAGVNRQYDGTVSNVSLHARAWCQCCRARVDAGRAAVRVCVYVRYVNGCVALTMWAGRDLSSTSLSGTLPESIGEMTGLLHM